MKTTIAWILAIIITITASIYQKKTGPTYPKKEKISVENFEYNFKLIRTHGGESNADIILNLPEDFNGKISYKKYSTNEEWTTIDLNRKGDLLSAELPQQPPAGKLEYYLQIDYKNKSVFDNSKNPVVIRFKGDVPAYILIPHILFMFLAMLISTLAGIFAISKNPKQKKYGIITLLLLIIGGGILGPIVQKFAFGEYWTGVPFGWDLTDNKTLIALIFWIIAVIANIKKERPAFTIIAAIILIIIFAIPHSLFGSQLDPNTGEVIQGLIFNPISLF